MKKYLKFGLPIGITLLLAWFLLRSGIQWGDLRAILDQAQWAWLGLALLCTACAYGAVAWLNEILLQRYGSRVPYRKQLLIQLAMAFIETVVPSAAVSGVLLRARLLKPYGVAADVATATTLVETTLLSASVILPALPLAFIAMLEGMQGFGTLGHWLFVILGPTLVIGITAGQWNAPGFIQFRARSLHRTVHFWEQSVQPRWPGYFAQWPAKRVTERIRFLWTESRASLRLRPYAILFSLAIHFALEGLSLISCFYALGQRLPVTTLLLLYPLTIAINTFGAVPGGVGLAEVSLSALYAQFGIAIEVAVAIALTYRLSGFWFPRVVGGLAWLWMERARPAEPSMDSQP